MPTNQKYRRGIENMPLKEPNIYQPITIFLIDLYDKDNVVHQEDLDLASVPDRKRLGRLTAWAVMNGHSVETMSKRDAEADYVKDGK